MNSKAFSLVELSIVLVIIGLLTSGVIGSSNLTENAKIRNVVASLRNIEQEIMAFKIYKGRLPGDCNDDLTFQCNFAYPYDGTNEEYGKPNSISAPFVDLYIEKVSDFQPRNTQSITRDPGGQGIIMNNNYAVPSILNNNKLPIGLNFGMTEAGGENHYRYQINQDRIFLIIHSYYRELKSDFSEKIDLKMDDGTYNHGVIRGGCIGAGFSRYQVPYNKSQVCEKVIYQTNLHI